MNVHLTSTFSNINVRKYWANGECERDTTRDNNRYLLVSQYNFFSYTTYNVLTTKYIRNMWI